MEFEEALARLGFHDATGRRPRGVRVVTADPDRCLTCSVQPFTCGMALGAVRLDEPEV